MRRALPWIIPVALLMGWCCCFPPIHFRSLGQVRAGEAAATFNPTNFVAQFWSEKLLPAASQAVEADKVVALVATDPAKVRVAFGRTIGVSSSYFLFLRGTARVVSADAESIGLSLKAEGTNVDITVPVGLVFGNALRDATGLLDSSSYPNAIEFNDISAALNQMVETSVLPEIQRVATPGKRVSFAGCVEVGDEESDLKPLKLTPLFVKPE